MQLQAVTTALPVEVLEDPSFLQPGAEIVARVAAAASPGGGHGLLALAGFLLPARLPPELAAGTRLPLVVAGRDADTLVLRVRADGQPRGQDAAPPDAFAGALAASGDGELLQAALVLSPGKPLALPDGGRAAVSLDGGRPGGGRASARVVVHSPRLGPIEIRLRLGDAEAAAHVVVDPAAAPVAWAAAPELSDRVGRVSAAPCRVTLEKRSPDGPAPSLALDFDAYA